MKKIISKNQNSMKRLLWKSDNGYLFPTMLKRHRIRKKLSRSQLGKLVGKEHYQIQRYEQPDGSANQQIPPLTVFADLCVALQIDPVQLLGLKWSTAIKNPEPGLIYDWNVDSKEDLINPKFRKFMWMCSNCNTINCEYDAYDRKKNKFVRNEFMCEKCSIIFTKLLNNPIFNNERPFFVESEHFKMLISKYGEFVLREKLGILSKSEEMKWKILNKDKDK